MYLIYVIKCLLILLDYKKPWEIILWSNAREAAFTPQILSEHLLYARGCAGLCGSSGEQTNSLWRKANYEIISKM